MTDRLQRLQERVEDPLLVSTEANVLYLSGFESSNAALLVEGADAAAFNVGLGTGPGGAVPHAHPSDRVVEQGHLVVVDAGARVDGYNSDCTRTFAAGDIGEEARTIYDVCLEAQRAAVV